MSRINWGRFPPNPFPMNPWISRHGLKLIAAIMLVGALAGSAYLPYYYYQLTNWATTGAAIIAVMQARREGRMLVVWLFVLLAVAFNPIAPLYLDQIVWHYLDVIGTALLLFALLLGNPVTARPAVVRKRK